MRKDAVLVIQRMLKLKKGLASGSTLQGKSIDVARFSQPRPEEGKEDRDLS